MYSAFFSASQVHCAQGPAAAATRDGDGAGAFATVWTIAVDPGSLRPDFEGNNGDNLHDPSPASDEFGIRRNVHDSLAADFDELGRGRDGFGGSRAHGISRDHQDDNKKGAKIPGDSVHQLILLDFKNLLLYL
jgi:hypothetical protein